MFDLKLAKGTLAKLEAFRLLIEGWTARMDKEDAYELGHSIIMESGISKDIYGSSNPEDLSRQENLEEFLGGMQDFVESRKEEDRENETGLSDFLQEVALLTDLDSEERCRPAQGDADDHPFRQGTGVSHGVCRRTGGEYLPVTHVRRFHA